MSDEMTPREAEKPVLGSDGSDVIDEEHDFLSDAPGDPSLGYETQEFLKPRRVVGFVVFLVLMALAAMVGMYFLEQIWSKRAGPEPDPSPYAQGRRVLPDAPLLRAEPAKDMEQLSQEQGGRVNNYGWIDQAQGRAHIPVERAMDLVLEEGLPYREVAK